MIAGWASDADSNSSSIWHGFLRLWIVGDRRGVSGLENVQAGQRVGSMSELQILIRQMAADITAKACVLEQVRLERFMEWLVSHSSKVRGNGEPLTWMSSREQMELKLNVWLQSLPASGLLWEYRLILEEIIWWRDVDPSHPALRSAEKVKE